MKLLFSPSIGTQLLKKFNETGVFRYETFAFNFYWNRVLWAPKAESPGFESRQVCQKSLENIKFLRLILLLFFGQETTTLEPNHHSRTT